MDGKRPPPQPYSQQQQQQQPSSSQNHPREYRRTSINSREEHDIRERGRRHPYPYQVYQRSEREFNYSSSSTPHARKYSPHSSDYRRDSHPMRDREYSRSQSSGFYNARDRSPPQRNNYSSSNIDTRYNQPPPPSTDYSHPDRYFDNEQRYDNRRSGYREEEYREDSSFYYRKSISSSAIAAPPAGNYSSSSASRFYPDDHGTSGSRRSSLGIPEPVPLAAAQTRTSSIDIVDDSADILRRNEERFQFVASQKEEIRKLQSEKQNLQMKLRQNLMQQDSLKFDLRKYQMDLLRFDSLTENFEQVFYQT